MDKIEAISIKIERNKEYRDRLREIIGIALKLGWITPQKLGHSTMQLSEIEKCMIAMVDDFELNKFRKWISEIEK